MRREPEILRSKQSRRRALAGLIACMAAPVTAVASAIAPKLGVSQGSLVMADMVVAAVSIVACVWVLRT